MNRGGVFPPSNRTGLGGNPFTCVVHSPSSGPVRKGCQYPPPLVEPGTGVLGVGLPGNYLGRSEGIRWQVWH